MLSPPGFASTIWGALLVKTRRTLRALRAFLLSFKRGDPDWGLFPVAGLRGLPAVRWKLLNINNLKESNPGKHNELIQKLEALLSR